MSPTFSNDVSEKCTLNTEDNLQRSELIQRDLTVGCTNVCEMQALMGIAQTIIHHKEDLVSHVYEYCSHKLAFSFSKGVLVLKERGTKRNNTFHFEDITS
ncbi:hypothetical protein [Vibrio penaeicida]|uniref:hypothetical protein n=1 Tax=Vibrio penaeicida TaxID=104609 RepID=UPI000CEA4B3A|nr:hypothetical protein [Vibrio penaeicida]